MSKWYNAPRQSGKSTFIVNRAVMLYKIYQENADRAISKKDKSKLPKIPIILTFNESARKLLKDKVLAELGLHITRDKTPFPVLNVDEFLRYKEYYSNRNYIVLIDEASMTIDTMFKCLGVPVDTATLSVQTIDRLAF